MVACPVSYLACAAYPVSYFLDTGRTPRGGLGLGQRRLKFPALRAVRGAPFTSCHGPRAGGPRWLTGQQAGGRPGTRGGRATRQRLQ